MNAPIERPSFYEGQILGAADLTAGVEHGRGQMARHERYLHLWGIAEGLELVGVDKETANKEKYQEITVKAGIAIDSSGREVVLAEDTRLPNEEFEQSNLAVGQEPDAWFPVFLTGLDTVAPPPALAVGRCASNEPTRFLESFRFAFGRPGDQVFQDDAPAIGEGPAGSPGSNPSRILLGFVQWDDAIKQFTKVKQEHEGSRRRHAGVKADVVAARSGSVALRTRAAVEAGKPALVLDETDGGGLQFGLMDAAGMVTPPALLSVDAKGNLTVTGKVTAAAAAGSVQVQSGIAMDGVVLPLPPGVKQEDVGEGKVIVHIHVSPRIPSSPPPTPSHVWGAMSLECSVDPDRRVRCRNRWVRFSVGAPAVTRILDLAGSCNYTIIVSAPATEGGS